MIHSFFDRSVYWRAYEEIAVFTTIDTSSGRTFTALGVGRNKNRYQRAAALALTVTLEMAPDHTAHGTTRPSSDLVSAVNEAMERVIEMTPGDRSVDSIQNRGLGFRTPLD